MINKRILSFLIGFCIVVSGANAAVNQRGNARGTAIANNAGAQQSTATNAARAAKRGTSVVKPNTNSQPAASAAPKNGDITKRAATNNTPVKKPMAARAGATQKVIQTGQKVNTAATNSAVPQECQDAFYGCMDSFCMLDNASGGRCQCNDKIIELNKTLDNILKMDEQSYKMATEGVERIQLGDAEDQIMSTVESAKNAVKKNKSTVSWGSSIYDADDDSSNIDTSNLVNTFANKKGDALYKSAANMCVKSFPEQCKQYGKMVQLLYAQRIRSDCVAYENALKQQQSQSKQKLQSAKSALREAATTEFTDQNKYQTAGECAVEFAKCMQTTAECGSDYTGCVTLAARENMRNNTNGTVAKQTKIQGQKVAGSNITLAATTMESLLSKKEICAHVTKQCVNANKNDAVWNVFLRNAAPALKVAEETAESNLRMQCIPTIAECYKTACKSQIDPKDEEGSYDMCLSNPKVYKSLCKVQLEPCLEATGGTYDKPEDSSLWNGLVAALNSMKVDACTNQVRTCLTERCGDDFAGCVGLDTESIGLLCPVDKLTACVSDGRFSRDTKTGAKNQANIDEIREYVAEIGQGLAMQIDNSMLSVCQKALNDSMMKVCGDTETCDALIKDDKLGAKTLKYQICQFEMTENETKITGLCKSSLDQITPTELEKYGWFGSITGLLYWGYIDYNFNTNKFTNADEYIKNVDEQFGGIDDIEKEATRNVFNTEINQLSSTINNTISAIEADPTVQYCMFGRQIQGFDASKFGKKTKRVFNEQTNKFEMADASASRFPNLMDQTKRNIIANVLRGARDNYDEKYNAAYEQLMMDNVTTAQKIDHEHAAEIAKNTCDTWAANSVLPRSKTPANVWKWVGIALAIAAAIVASIFTCGTAGVGIAATFMALHGATFASAALGGAMAAAGSVEAGLVIAEAAGTASIAVLEAGGTMAAALAASAAAAGTTATVAAMTGATAAAVAVGGAAAIAGGAVVAAQTANKDKSDTMAKPGYAELDQWNYKAKITTLFNPQTGECKKETVYQNCTHAVYTTGKCKEWGSELTETQTIKLL